MLAETKKKEQLIYYTTHKMMLTRPSIAVCNENQARDTTEFSESATSNSYFFQEFDP